MATLTGDDLFGLNTIQKDTLNKILDYLNAQSALGVTTFPTIPQHMFFGFDLLETRSITDALAWEWNASSNPPAYVYEYAFPVTKAAAISKAVTTGLGLIRAVPSGFPTLPLSLVRVPQTGRAVVTLPNDAITAALAYNSSISNAGIYYVKPSTGNDTNAGTQGAPFATLTKALRTATGSASRIVMLEDAVFAPLDLRATDASQTTQQFKWVDANGFNVIFRDTGPALSAQTWVQDGTNTNCYTTTLATTGIQAVTRVLMTNVMDSYGYESQFTKYTSAALLNAGSGNGFYWDGAGKVLWLKIGAGTNVESQKANIRALYSVASQNYSRVLAYGAAIGFSGCQFEGVEFENQELSSRRPQIWLHNCVALWSPDKGFNATQGGIFVATDTTIYGARFDAANGFAPGPVFGKGLVQTARCSFIRSGDQAVFPGDGTLQGTSCHGGSDHVGWGNLYKENNGPAVQDTCSNTYNDQTWLVACDGYGYVGGFSSHNFFFGSAATGASRTVHLDTCTSTNPASGGKDMYADINSTVYTYNCTFPTTGGSAAIPYTPAAP